MIPKSDYRQTDHQMATNELWLGDASSLKDQDAVPGKNYSTPGGYEYEYNS